ncbi:NAD(P)H-hydrate epimerase [Furfurilactobacillus curtus]|uniref:NAD(P)H-hydrate epimerase n=1 Tax=Furfurilactobacillus curtus TaxID=1746200 RepID=A0ABQ5JQI3_9LACO
MTVKKAISAQQARTFDDYTINHLGIPSPVLMERAALAVTQRLTTSINFELTNVLIVAGSGNNGGDGIAVARLLHLRHIPVTVWLIGNLDHASEQLTQQYEIAKRYGIHVTQTKPDQLTTFTTVVDAVFGVGLSRPIAGQLAEAVQELNQTNLPILAIDIPSGIDADTGQPMGVAIQAIETITMSYNKIGLTTKSGQLYAGRITIADIGIYDPETIERLG